jgi:hypothetical protein
VGSKKGSSFSSFPTGLLLLFGVYTPGESATLLPFSVNRGAIESLVTMPDREARTFLLLTVGPAEPELLVVCWRRRDIAAAGDVVGDFEEVDADDGLSGDGVGEIS